MRKTVYIAVAFAAVLCGAITPVSSVQAADSERSQSAADILLAATKTSKQDAAEQSATAPQPSAAEAQPATAPQPVMITVQSGDSLSSIAETHGTSWLRLFYANTAIANPNIINPGDQLRVPTADEQLAERALPQTAVAVASTAPVSYTATTSSTRSTAAAAVSYPTDPNAAKAFIYSRESGNNPNATNPSGCYGIGQDCNGRVRNQCGADYACQDAYFTNYAMSRYGSWENAQAYWLSHHWW